MSKFCKYCNIQGETDHFYAEGSCKLERKAKYKNRYAAKKEEMLAKNREWQLKNPDRTKQLAHESYIRHKDAVLERTKKRRTETHVQRYREIAKRYKNTNRADINKKRSVREKLQRTNDPVFKIISNHRRRVRKWGSSIHAKHYSNSRALGCTKSYFKQYIEQQFNEDMTWENYGTYWHLDHIYPLSKVDWEDKEAVTKALHYTNLQPLEAQENMLKSNRLDYAG